MVLVLFHSPIIHTVDQQDWDMKCFTMIDMSDFLRVTPLFFQSPSIRHTVGHMGKTLNFELHLHLSQTKLRPFSLVCENEYTFV